MPFHLIHHKNMPNPEIHIIVAMAKNRVIGSNNTIPWHIPEDLAHFKAITTGHGILMGRKTWESIGHPLPDRTNIIISKKQEYKVHGCLTATSLQKAIQIGEKHHSKLFIIGGGQIYKEALSFAHAIHITLLHCFIQGNIFFPDIPEDQFTLKSEHQHHWAQPVTLQYFTKNK